MAKETHRETPYPLRMPPEMRQALEVAAANAGRSLHQELMWRLQASLDRDEKELDQLFDRVAVLEKTVAELQQKLI